MEVLLLGYIVDMGSRYQDAAERTILENRNMPIDLTICSNGGDVFKGLELCTMIKTHPMPTKAILCGSVASIATVVAMCCDKVHMDYNCTMLIHNAMGGNFGTSEELRQTADQLDQISKSIMGYYVGRIAKNGKLVNGSVADTEKMLAELMTKDQFLSASECLDMGLVDKLVNCDVPQQAPEEETEDLAAQLATQYPQIKNQFPNFKNSFSKMENKTPLTQEEAKGFFAKLAALFGFKNEAAEAVAEPVAPVVIEEPKAIAAEEITEEKAIELLKAKGYAVSKQAEAIEEKLNATMAQLQEAQNQIKALETVAVKAQAQVTPTTPEAPKAEKTTFKNGFNHFANILKSSK